MGYKTDIFEAALSDLPWKRLCGKNILIIGATGLIGGCVVDILMSRKDIDYNVYASGRNAKRAQKRFKHYLESKHFHFFCQDIRERIISDIDFNFIIDAASGASPQIYDTDPVGVVKSNILGVANLIDYGIGHHLEKFVYVSSGEVYGEGDGRTFTEDYSGYVNPMNSRSCYPSAKRAAETLCASYAHQYGTDVSVARPSHIYGPHFTESDNRVYAQFIRNILANEDIVMKSKGLQFRSWCYVVDCAKALLYILFNGKNGEAYNIADSKSNITIKELAELIAEIGNKKVNMMLSEKKEAGGSPITKAVFDTTKLENIGWSITNDMKSKMTSTINEQKNYEND